MQIRKTVILLLSFILLGTAQRAHSQAFLKDDPSLVRGTNDYKALRYANAIEELLKVIAKTPDNVNAQEMLADSYRNIKNYDEALHWYGELSKQKQLKPEWALYYAEALANKQRYEESEQWYAKYLALKPSDRRAASFSKANMNSFTQNSADWKVSYTNINTDASEYSPLFYKDGLIFVSNRQVRSRFIFEWDKTPFTDLYVIDHLSDITAAEPGSKTALADQSGKAPMTGTEDPGAKSYPLRGREKSNYHEGPAAILPEGSLIFTRNNYSGGIAKKSVDGINKLKLYTASGFDWEKITSFPYNSNEYSNGHPTISKDGLVLVFTSDKPGGFGGTDLYYSVRTSDKGKWGDPVNLGQRINTEGNEMFPYLDPNGKLYFASTGHAGLGGLDIFEVVLKDMKATTDPHNLGAPVNSSADDFGLIAVESGKSGFFSSNRRGNDDIYQFTRAIGYAVALKGVVVDSRTNQPVGGSKVVFRHNGIADSLVTNANGQFTKPLLRETDYDIHGTMTAYVGGDAFVTTNGVTSDSTINVVLKLSKATNPQQWVMDHCDSLKKLFTLPKIYYDLDRSYIRADARQTLDQVADLLVKHPELTVITSSHTDTRASEEYNQNLSLLRGRATQTYLASKGVDPKRVEIKYYGKTRLVNTCTDGVPCPEDEQQKNRRTEFEVIINGVNLTQLNCTK